mmetsp:Transcript_22695/g.70458  ORF Transcript_22695/g.70458 Transcript_22695/m.70458 type:complete len:330 (-) Transcript_22695:47-1036(-)
MAALGRLLLVPLLLLALAAASTADKHTHRHHHQAEFHPTEYMTREVFGRLEKEARGGMVIAGDSPSRRLYMRALYHLEGINDEAYGEHLQNTAKLLDHDKQAQERLFSLGLTDKNSNEPFTRYKGTGPRAGLYNIEFLTDYGNMNDRFMEGLVNSSAGLFVYGFPFLHVLYNPQWDTRMCHEGFDFEAAVMAQLRALDAWGEKNPGTRVVVTSANAYNSREDENNGRLIKGTEDGGTACGAQCARHVCDRLSQTNKGMGAATAILAKAVQAFPRLCYADVNNVLEEKFVPFGVAFGGHGGHWNGTVIDAKMAKILEVAEGCDTRGRRGM